MLNRPKKQGFTLLELLIVITIIAILAAIALPKLFDALKSAKRAVAIGEIQGLHRTIESYRVFNGGNPPATWDEIGEGPMPEDPWGFPYVYNNFDEISPGLRRKDGPLVPINKEYDLFSTGPNGDWVPNIHAGPSADDLILANDGGFIGPTADY